MLTIKQIVSRCKQHPDRWLVRMVYRAEGGERSERLVSPVRLSRDRSSFLALCLTREDCRWFRFSRCIEPRIVDARLYCMPWLPGGGDSEVGFHSPPGRVASSASGEGEG